MNLFNYYCHTKRYSVYKIEFPNGTPYYGMTNNTKRRVMQHRAPSSQITNNVDLYKKHGKPVLKMEIPNLSIEMAKIIEWAFISINYYKNTNVNKTPYIDNRNLLEAICGILNLTVNLEKK